MTLPYLTPDYVAILATFQQRHDAAMQYESSQSFEDLGAALVLAKALASHFEALTAERDALAEKVNTQFAKGFARGQESIKRKNQSGCCCIIDDNDVITSFCGGHQEAMDKLVQRVQALEGAVKVAINAISEIQGRHGYNAILDDAEAHLNAAIQEPPR